MNNEESAEEKLEMIANTTDLETAISRLELRRKIQETELKIQSQQLLESLKPANILRHTLEEVRESTPLKNNLFKVALGLGAGYLSKQMVVGQSAGVLKKALGTALQYGITHFVAKKDDTTGYNAGDFSTGSKKKGIFSKLFAKLK